MNPQDNDLQPPADTGPVPDAEATPKPRKRRAPAKSAASEAKAAAAESEAAATDMKKAEVQPAPSPAEPGNDAASSAGSGSEAAPAKPKRTRRKVAVSPDEAPVAQMTLPMEPVPAHQEAPAAETIETASRPASSEARVGSGAQDETGVLPSAAAPAPHAPLAPPVLAVPAAAVVVSDDAEDDRPPRNDADAAPGGEADSGTDGTDESPRRRNRNRRRGRRSGDRQAAETATTEGTDAPPLAAPEGAHPARSVVDEDDQEDDDETQAVQAAAPLPPADAGDTFADVLSGAYDALPTEDLEAVPERRVLAAEPDAPKLHKVLAQAGIGSRRDMEQLIADGRVTVNGQPAHTGQRISFGDQIKIGGKPVKVRIVPPLPRVLAYHKPVGEVVTHDDPQHRPTVFRRLPRLPQGKWQSVGRLDINTEGLLLFTNSGELAHQLMHPRFGVEREYAVRVLGTLDEDARETLLEGVDIDGQRAAFKSITDGGGEGANHWYRVVIAEGRNREVRKLFDSVDLTVSRLIRIRYGCVVLPRGLKRGVCVDLNEAEVRELRRQAGGQREGQAGGGPRPVQEGAGGAKSRRNRRGGRDRNDRNERNERTENRNTDRGDRFERREPGEGGPIPNPLQQTFDKRAIREARQPRREYSEDGPIPNPLEQTYDKRFVQKQRGMGGGGGRRQGGGDGGGGGQPDPMKTSLGYIGADAFVRKFQGGGGGGGRGGKRRGGR
jgi:23S rRNA pseudouridine2605 synthase